MNYPWCDIFLLILLLIITIQDFLHRQISWILLPLLFITFGIKASLSRGLAEAGIIFLKNIGFLVIQMLALFTCYFLKERKPVNLINKQVGAGDLLFFLAIGPAFSLLNFLFFYLVAILLTLAGYLLFRLLRKNASPEVPLAGAVSFIMALFIILQYLSVRFNPYEDEIIISFLSTWKQ